MYSNKECIRIRHLTKVLDCIDNVEMRIKANGDYVTHEMALSQLIDESIIEVARLKSVLNRLNNRYFAVLNS